MDDGRSFVDIVFLNEAGDDVEIITAKEAEKRKAIASITNAYDACVAILKKLPVKEAKKVLAQLKSQAPAFLLEDEQEKKPEVASEG
jgi:hypothetical protein